MLLYIDDVLVYSKSFNQHLSHLRLVFDTFRKFNFTLSLKKCAFFSNETKFLGHIVSADGIKMDPEKISAIQAMNTKKRKELHSMLCKAAFYRRFIHNFASRTHDIAAWLRHEKREKALIPERLQKSIAYLKNLLCQDVLVHPDFNKPFQLFVDASDYGIGAVLMQDGRPIEYYSRQIRHQERAWHISEKECLSVVAAVLHFKPYLISNNFTIFTDHKNLVSIFEGRKGKTPRSQRLLRWLLALQDFDFYIQHVEGTKNPSDILSRIPQEELIQSSKLFEALFSGDISSPPKDIQDGKMLGYVEGFDAEFQEEQRRDPKYRAMIMFKSFGTVDRRYATFVSKASQYYSLSLTGILLRKGKVCVPRHLIKHLLSVHHDLPTAAHTGSKKLYATISTRYYWETMRKDCRRYTVSCLK